MPESRPVPLWGIPQEGSASNPLALNETLLRDTDYEVVFYQPSTNRSGVYKGHTDANGAPAPIGTIILDQFSGLDSDFDGIPDIGEFAIGTFANASDSDGDGRSDAVEIEAGTDPTIPPLDLGLTLSRLNSLYKIITGQWNPLIAGFADSSTFNALQNGFNNQIADPSVSVPLLGDLATGVPTVDTSIPEEEDDYGAASTAIAGNPVTTAALSSLNKLSAGTAVQAPDSLTPSLQANNLASFASEIKNVASEIQAGLKKLGSFSTQITSKLNGPPIQI